MQDSSRINLSSARFMIVDDNDKSLKILCDLVRSFGAGSVTAASSAFEAQELMSRQRFDLLITDAVMPDYDGYALVRWLRARPNDDERIIPALIVSAHTREEEIALGRDCGAHFVIAKPISPTVLLERIFWIATHQRNFLVCDSYAGPDRRWKNRAPPSEFGAGRRKSDLSIEIGAATDANLSGDAIDALLKPQKVRS